MNIDPELLKRLDQLIEKLGLKAGQGWDLLVRQAYIDAFSWLPFLILWIVVTVVLLKVSRLCVVKANDDGEELWWIARVVCLLAAVGSAAGVCTCSSEMIRILLNPQGYALRTLLWTIR